VTRRPIAVAAGALLVIGALAAGHVTKAGAQPAPSFAPSPGAMATQPDPREFITRADTGLLTQGNPLRFAGINISWLGLRDDSGHPADARLPTSFEVQDMLDTALAMGAGTIRVLSLGASAGCALCLQPSPGELNPDALKHMDHVLKQTRDAGLKLVIPLAGPGNNCPAGNVLDPVYDTPCIFARWRGKPDASFYSDAEVRADFAHYVSTLLRHVNAETGLAYKDDPTIMAWENCDGCGAKLDTRILADWTEFLGRTIKVVDKSHLYENGAFGGRLGHQPGAAAPEQLALSSVDIIGDRANPPPGTAPDAFVDALQAVTKAGRVYFIDEYDWAPAHFPSVDDLTAFLAAVVTNRAVTGAFVSDVNGHADQGGYLGPTRPGQPVLYFPGTAAPPIDADAMQARARAVRRFSYHMLDMLPLAFAQTPAPEIISAVHGKLQWRGAAGALKYSVERTGDVTLDGSWKIVCDQCASDAEPSWQDPSVPTGPAWYRMTPYNANLHLGIPSDPMQNK
jgi:mannan endo-1,4-beta-mannosidase